MRPRLIHPVNIRLFKRIDTEIDLELGGTGNVVFAEPVMLKGQLNLGAFDKIRMSGAGNDPDADGYIVFMASDFNGKTGDEMAAPNTDSRFVVTEVRPCAHYGGNNWQVRAYFTRKKAAK